jgi:hypothetical protein
MAQATYATSGIGALITGASVEQFASPIRAVHAQIAQILAGFLSLTFPLAVEFEDRVGQSNKLLHVISIADDTGRVA